MTPLYLQQLSLVDFRCCEAGELVFSPKVNCFAGLNGSGKTNLLDAVHYLSLTKSAFNPVDSQNIRYDAPFFVLQGTFLLDGQEEHVYCGVRRGQKKVFRRNQKEYERLSDHIGLFPLVMISPSDAALVYEGSEERRKFMDGVISQFDKNYLDMLLEYNRVLQQRNALLRRFSETRSFDAASLSIWDEQLVAKGEPLHAARLAFVRDFTPIFNEYYRYLSGDREQVELVYSSQLAKMSLSALLENALPRDRAIEHTTVGVHKDDLDFRIGAHALKKSGSQGQQKTFLIALKLAQLAFIRIYRKKMPILLLDDIYDKLDEQRVQRLMDLVCGDDFGQIFITDTGVGRMRELFEGKGVPFKIFSIEEGKISG